jgi:type I restriction-modification system DNA methylase subunit
VTRFAVPRRFWDDHAERVGREEAGTFVKNMARNVIVDLTEDQLFDLWQDADLYATAEVSDLGREYKGVVFSARATVRRLAAQTEMSLEDLERRRLGG